jgi:hypothetical protein
MSRLDEQKEELKRLIKLDTLRLAAAKAMFDLGVFEEEPETAKRWFGRYARTLATLKTKLELYKSF